MREWHRATVPGTVHTDLMANGLIADPYFGMNERDVQWIDKEDWDYKAVFYGVNDNYQGQKTAVKEVTVIVVDDKPFLVDGQ